ncbi:helix-turn-helix transcriptional regulator [Rhizobium sp. LjRoot30]|uniref:AraC family ligand binding domain-containing protein n=1 Tax=Rhizobium sp. LjRoot30 TaxID=3342320 RepID=UPI003ECE5C5F
MTIGIATLTGRGDEGGKAQHFIEAPFHDKLPSPLFFRAARIPADTTYPKHRHSWGELVYSFSGVLEVALADAHYLVPPQYGVWLPPDVEHRGLSRHEAYHCSLYVSAEFAKNLPDTTCALEISPLIRSMLDHLRLTQAASQASEENQRFLQVVIDLLGQTKRVGTYLPWSTDPQLEPILRHLEKSPGDNHALAEHARIVGTTERTVIRRCLRDLGMPFSEWKQRLRVVKAMPLLEANETVEAIAAQLGYQSASAFIAMFKRMTGTTPDEYRNSASP